VNDNCLLVKVLSTCVTLSLRSLEHNGRFSGQPVGLLPPLVPEEKLWNKWRKFFTDLMSFLSPN